VLVTEQYPKGLGHTLAALLPMLEHASTPRIEKLHFSACASEAVLDFLTETKPRRVIVIGMEAHVCVFQTVRDLVARGHSVHLPVDGVVSRRDDHREVGVALAARAGAIPTTAETIAFDWLERAGTPEFKALSQLLR
jgi:nicotinamidase-related amidase